MSRNSLDECCVCGGPVVNAGVICDSPVCRMDLAAFLEDKNPRELIGKMYNSELIFTSLVEEFEDTLHDVSAVVEDWISLVAELSVMHDMIKNISDQTPCFSEMIIKIKEFERRLVQLKDNLD